MPQIKYNTYQIQPDSGTGYEDLSAVDKTLISNFQVNSLFDSKSHRVELHIYSLDGELIESKPTYTNESFLQGSQTAGTAGAASLTLFPEQDVINYGYEYGEVKLVYNFLNNLYSNTKTGPNFFIEEISPDRTEIRLLTTLITDQEISNYTQIVQEKLNSTSYFADFRLNFSGNELIIGTNIKTQNYKNGTSIVVKLYEPLPEQYTIKNTVQIEEVVSDTVVFEVEGIVIPDDIKIPQLKGPNFNLDVVDDANISSEYLNYDELFNYPTNNNYRELKSLFEEKGIEVSIDYTDYTNFVHYSSAEERLRNFKYKLDLIESYQTSIDVIESANNTEAGITGSTEYYTGLIDNILSNFDHYDRFLYYQSSSYAWPKVNSTKPYVNDTTSTGSYWSTQVLSASEYDASNPHQLVYSVPSYLREDPNNEKYNMFINMLGQHFDNLWIYTKAVTDKYDNDNRLDSGISKDLVQDALKNFGVKLYTSNRSTQDLFKMFTGEFYQTGSEQINTYLTASNQPTSEENYRKEVYKRVYHNLPLLLKSKGTERGLRALINSFGIPTSYSTGVQSGLLIKTAGGTDTGANINTGPAFSNTSSLAKIRIDNTGSIVEGNTLSIDTSIVSRTVNVTDDINTIDIGYSPTDPINELIYTALTASGFNIDDYIGDPQLAHSSSYDLLISASNAILIPAVNNSYDLQDFTRVLKFYDNVIFKMIKDFIPARSNASTGIIVKPHILERNKQKQVQGTFTQNLITGSISIGEYSGSDGQSYEGSLTKTTNYTSSYMTSGGLAFKDDHLKEQAKFNGELSGSRLQISQTDFLPVNPFKYAYSSGVSYKLNVETYEPDPTNTPTPTPTTTPTLTATPTPTPTVGVSATPTGTPTPTPTLASAETFYRLSTCTNGTDVHASKINGCVGGTAGLLGSTFTVGDVVQFVYKAQGCSSATYCGTVQDVNFPAPTNSENIIISSDQTFFDCNDQIHCSQ